MFKAKYGIAFLILLLASLAMAQDEHITNLLNQPEGMSQALELPVPFIAQGEKLSSSFSEPLSSNLTNALKSTNLNAQVVLKSLSMALVAIVGLTMTAILLAIIRSSANKEPPNFNRLNFN